MNDFFDFTQDPAWCSGRFPARWRINGRTEDVESYFFIAGASLSVSDKEHTTSQHRHIGLHPLDRGMIATHIPAELKSGVFFEVSGTRVGTFREGRSFAYGEGEYVSRPIRKFRIESKYLRSHIEVKLSCRAEAAPEDRGKVDGWELAVEFEISRSDFRGFFALNDLGMRTYEEVYNRYVGENV
jgi:hypothetical protein